MASPAPGRLLLLLLLVVAVAAATLELAESAGLGDAPAPEAAPGLVSFTGGKGNYKKMAREFVKGHNKLRGAHREEPYVWNRRLARYARRWTERLRENCTILHSMGPYGENMFWGTGWDWRATDAVRSWGSERFDYDSADNSCKPGAMCGHFTQIVWNDTVRLGCARVECYAGGVLITCNYDPPGNWVGERPFVSQ